MNEQDGKLPIGIMRQAVLKLDSFITDMAECMEDPDISDSDRESFSSLKDMAGEMEAQIVSVAMSEIGEEDFLNETIEMDPLPSAKDLMDEEI